MGRFIQLAPEDAALVFRPGGVMEGKVPHDLDDGDLTDDTPASWVALLSMVAILLSSDPELHARLVRAVRGVLTSRR